MNSVITQSNSNRDNLFLLSVPLVMAGSCLAGIAIGPLRHTGLFWIMTLVVGFLLVPLKGLRKVTFPWLGWLPFYAFFGASLFWSEMDWRFNIQMYFQMLVYPIVGIIASYTIDSEDELASYNSLYIAATLFIGLCCAYFMLGPGRAIQENIGNASLYTGFAERIAAMSLIVTGCIFLAQFHIIPKTAVAMWLICFGISVLSQSRMATVVLLLLWLIHPRLATLKQRILITGSVCLIGILAFNTPIIQDRFFAKKSGLSGKGTMEDVLKGKFDSAGRFETWPIVIEKSADTPWLGHGVGESAPFILSVWAPMDKPHNEYLKCLYDGGYLGLGAFVIGLFSTFLNITWNLRKAGARNWAASAAYMGWISFILMAVCDNPLVSGNNFLHPIFFLVGAANGITARLMKTEESPPMEVNEVDDRFDATTPRFLKPIMMR